MSLFEHLYEIKEEKNITDASQKSNHHHDETEQENLTFSTRLTDGEKN